VISPEQLSLLFLHLSKKVHECNGELQVEYIIEEIIGEGDTSEEKFLFDATVEYNCTEFETLQFIIAKVTQALRTYKNANYVELYFYDKSGKLGSSITLDSEYTQEDADLAEEDEEDEESEIDNSVCGFECNEQNENCNEYEPGHCQGCPSLNKCSCCKKYPCEKLLKEEKANEARVEAALQEDLDL
jgi:hypothetical protein